MASVFVYAMDTRHPEHKAERGVSFTRPDGKRRALKLGAVNLATARGLKNRVESLLRCRITRSVPSPELLQWLGDIPNTLHKRLVANGLADPRVAPVEVPTPAAWCDEYIGERMGTLKRASVLILERTAALLREYYGGDALIGDIDEAGARDWRAWLRSRPVARGVEGDPVPRRVCESTVRKYIRGAKAIFTAASKARLIPGNPFAGLAGGALAAKRDRHLTEDEAERIIAEIPGADHRLIFALGRYAGLRVPSESHTLRWGDIDWDRGRMTVQSVKTERFAGHTERVVPVHPRLRVQLMDAFEAAPEGRERVIRASRNTILHRIVREAVRRAGIAPLARPYQVARRAAKRTGVCGFHKLRFRGGLGIASR